MSKIGKSIETESRLVVALGLGVLGKWGMTAKGYGVSFWVDESVLKFIVMVAAQLCEYTKNHWIVCFKSMNGMLCEL